MKKNLPLFFVATMVILLTTFMSLCTSQEQNSDVNKFPSRMSFDEFKAQAFTETYNGVPTGIYIVDGHTPIDGLPRMQQLYDEYVSAYNQAFGISIVYSINGVDIVWDETQKKQLTYCVSTTFESRMPQVIQAMEEATASWESAANIKFIYVPLENDNCTSTNSNVVFNVTYTSGQIYLARSFWPNSARLYRNVMIDEQSFNVSYPLTLTGILRHELGHTIGLRHEHTRPEAGTCFEDNQWRPLTQYDSSSIMHYPQCNGTGDWSLDLTSSDIIGISSIYGPRISD